MNDIHCCVFCVVEVLPQALLKNANPGGSSEHALLMQSGRVRQEGGDTHLGTDFVETGGDGLGRCVTPEHVTF